MNSALSAIAGATIGFVASMLALVLKEAFNSAGSAKRQLMHWG